MCANNVRTCSNAMLRLHGPFALDDANDDASTRRVGATRGAYAHDSKVVCSATTTDADCTGRLHESRQQRRDTAAHADDTYTTARPSADGTADAVGLQYVVLHVWGALGLCRLPHRPHSRSGSTPEQRTAPAAPATSTAAAASCMHRGDDDGGADDDDDDTRLYIQLLHELYATSSRASDDSTLRYALWWLLCNAAYYCAALATTASTTAVSRAPHDGDAGSTNNSRDDGDNVYNMQAVVRLTHVPRQNAHDDSDDADGRASLPASDWAACLRRLSHLGYRRAHMYTQTPSHASPHELLLALLWLTQRYELVAAAEYVVLSRQCSCLLRFAPVIPSTVSVQHNSHNDNNNNSNNSSSSSSSSHGVNKDKIACSDGNDSVTATSAVATRAVRLLAAFPRAAPWPPVSYDEDETIARRLSQIDNILGDGARHDGAAMLTRRVLTLHRLIVVALARIEHALQQRAEQVVALGLHNSLDAQLCQSRGVVTAYETLVAGLQHVCTCEERVRHRLRCLRAAGSLVAAALRRSRASLSAASQLPRRAVADALRSDTNAQVHASPAVAAASSSSSLHSVLSTFAATHTRDALDDVWRSMLRRRCSRGARHDTKTDGHDGSDADGRVLDDAVARVRRSMRVQYSLQSSLAAEVLLMMRQQQQQQQQHRSRHRPSPPLSLSSAQAAQRACSTARVSLLAPLLTFVTHHAMDGGDGRCAAVLRGSSLAQPTEVGTPAARETTSARVEAERLTRLLQLMEEQPVVQQQRHTRAAYARTTLQQLRDVYKLRVVDWQANASATSGTT